MMVLELGAPWGHVTITPVPHGAGDAALHPEEQAFAALQPALRQNEWSAGRAALRAAIRAAGLLCDGPILANPYGAPLLPPAIAGSLSHKEDRAAAVAARAAGWTLGIDLERQRPRTQTIERRVLTDAERSATPSGDDGRSLMLRFCAKEALYKAIHPHLRRYVGFQEVATWPGEDGTVRFDPLPVGVVAEGRWIADGDHFIVLVRARAV